MSQATIESNAWEQLAAWVARIAGDIRYGTVEITIHDARIVQLEVSEKFRSPPGMQPGAERRERNANG